MYMYNHIYVCIILYTMRAKLRVVVDGLYKNLTRCLLLPIELIKFRFNCSPFEYYFNQYDSLPPTLAIN